jgi:hypothetical protein
METLTSSSTVEIDTSDQIAAAGAAVSAAAVGLCVGCPFFSGNSCLKPADAGCGGGALPSQTAIQKPADNQPSILLAEDFIKKIEQSDGDVEQTAGAGEKFLDIFESLVAEAKPTPPEKAKPAPQPAKPAVVSRVAISPIKPVVAPKSPIPPAQSKAPPKPEPKPQPETAAEPKTDTTKLSIKPPTIAAPPPKPDIKPVPKTETTSKPVFQPKTETESPTKNSTPAETTPKIVDKTTATIEHKSSSISESAPSVPATSRDETSELSLAALINQSNQTAVTSASNNRPIQPTAKTTKTSAMLDQPKVVPNQPDNQQPSKIESSRRKGGRQTAKMEPSKADQPAATDNKNQSTANQRRLNRVYKVDKSPHLTKTSELNIQSKKPVQEASSITAATEIATGQRSSIKAERRAQSGKPPTTVRDSATIIEKPSPADIKITHAKKSQPAEVNLETNIDEPQPLIVEFESVEKLQPLTNKTETLEKLQPLNNKPEPVEELQPIVIKLEPVEELHSVANKLKPEEKSQPLAIKIEAGTKSQPAADMLESADQTPMVDVDSETNVENSPPVIIELQTVEKAQPPPVKLQPIENAPLAAALPEIVKESPRAAQDNQPQLMIESQAIIIRRDTVLQSVNQFVFWSENEQLLTTKADFSDQTDSPILTFNPKASERPVLNAKAMASQLDDEVRFNRYRRSASGGGTVIKAAKSSQLALAKIALKQLLSRLFQRLQTETF